MHRDFKTWLLNEKKDIFGFERQRERLAPPPPDTNPVRPVTSDPIMDELSRYSLAVKHPRRSWKDIIEWGDGNTGSLRVYMSPLGSFKATIRRKIDDLEGTPTWICKQVFPIRDHPRSVNEVKLSSNIEEALARIDQELVEMPKGDYEGLRGLVEALAGRIRAEAPPLFMFGGVTRQDEDEYIIYLNLCGYGVEAPSARRVEQFHINVAYESEKGLIRCWGNDIDSPTNQHIWMPKPSEWDEYFSPAQSRKEICDAVINALKIY